MRLYDPIEVLQNRRRSDAGSGASELLKAFGAGDVKSRAVQQVVEFQKEQRHSGVAPKRDVFSPGGETTLGFVISAASPRISSIGNSGAPRTRRSRAVDAPSYRQRDALCTR